MNKLVSFDFAPVQFSPFSNCIMQGRSIPYECMQLPQGVMRKFPDWELLLQTESMMDSVPDLRLSAIFFRQIEIQYS